MNRISQREARRLRKENERLTNKINALTSRFGADYPGIHLRTLSSVDLVTLEALRVAIVLGRPIAARVGHNDGQINFYAVPVAP